MSANSTEKLSRVSRVFLKRKSTNSLSYKETDTPPHPEKRATRATNPPRSAHPQKRATRATNPKSYPQATKEHTMTTISRPSSYLKATNVTQTDRRLDTKELVVKPSQHLSRGRWQNTVELATASQLIELTPEQAVELAAAIIGAAGLKYGPNR